MYYHYNNLYTYSKSVQFLKKNMMQWPDHFQTTCIQVQITPDQKVLNERAVSQTTLFQRLNRGKSIDTKFATTANVCEHIRRSQQQ